MKNTEPERFALDREDKLRAAQRACAAAVVHCVTAAPAHCIPTPGGGYYPPIARPTIKPVKIPTAEGACQWGWSCETHPRPTVEAKAAGAVAAVLLDLTSEELDEIAEDLYWIGALKEAWQHELIEQVTLFLTGDHPEVIESAIDAEIARGLLEPTVKIIVRHLQAIMELAELLAATEAADDGETVFLTDHEVTMFLKDKGISGPLPSAALSKFTQMGRCAEAIFSYATGELEAEDQTQPAFNYAPDNKEFKPLQGAEE